MSKSATYAPIPHSKVPCARTSGDYVVMLPEMSRAVRLATWRAQRNDFAYGGKNGLSTLTLGVQNRNPPARLARDVATRLTSKPRCSGP